ncbi:MULTISPECIES: hypothetical protein [unclassified Microbacterium]|uniref:hypothetical protein n=1 Tax=unclassified Microbacterium TaxID=2609290 RepID=UPI002883478C|nr:MULTISPECIES: hypothetical protein [unclassified Microbacterium]
MTAPFEIDLDWLEMAAQEATPGPWELDHNLPFSTEIQGLFQPELKRYVVGHTFDGLTLTPQDGVYLQLLDPTTVLQIIAHIRDLETQVAALTAAAAAGPKVDADA